VDGVCYCERGWAGKDCRSPRQGKESRPAPSKPHTAAELFIDSLDSVESFEHNTWPTMQTHLASSLHKPTADVVLLRVVPQSSLTERHVGLAVTVAVVCDVADQRVVLQALQSVSAAPVDRLNSVSNLQLGDPGLGLLLRGIKADSVQFVAARHQVTATSCPFDCNLRGECVNEVCACDEGWFGTSCNTESQCEAGCEDRQKCNNETQRCECIDGWTGELCWDKLCDPEDCNGRGTCNNGTCACDEGWGGDACQYEDLCDGSPVCSGHGSCELVTDDEENKLMCTCNKDYYGTDCHAHLPLCVTAPGMGCATVACASATKATRVTTVLSHCRARVTALVVASVCLARATASMGSRAMTARVACQRARTDARVWANASTTTASAPRITLATTAPSSAPT
jgi:hypothetical protein